MQSNTAMIDLVKDLLKNNLSEYYSFHNIEHTLFVIENAVLIAKNEKCSYKEIKLIEVASIWHDVGYIRKYYGHEEESCNIAKDYLPNYGYDNEQIETICGIIMATKTPQSPKNLLEEIVADADLIYLGYPSPQKTADLLYKELRYLNPLLDIHQWNKMQINFLSHHKFFTDYCKTNHEPIKQVYLQELIERQK